jgi:hydrogenase maturation protease
MAVLVLGLGNTLMSDDGFGVHVVEALRSRYRMPEGVALLDGGTLGLDLLPRLEGVKRLLIVDALQMGGTPGAVYHLRGEEVPRAFAAKLSVHQMGVQDLLAVAELQGHLPAELVVWGVQAGVIDMGLDLTPEVSGALEEVLSGIVAELSAWGVPPVGAAA